MHLIIRIKYRKCLVNHRGTKNNQVIFQKSLNALLFSDHLGHFWTTCPPFLVNVVALPKLWFIGLLFENWNQVFATKWLCTSTFFFLLQVTNLIRHTMAHQHTRSARPITSPSIRPSTNTKISKNVMTSQRKSVNTWKKRYLDTLFSYLFLSTF